ncbi:MAG TPA: DUF4097 family beta strand repeat-containing protein [Planctomycetota bacterium]
MSRPTLALASLVLSACHVSLHDHVVVDGVELEHHHEEVLTLASWPVEGLTIEAHRGDLRVEHGEGPTTLRVRIHEREPGAAHAHVDGGRLVARARDGEVCAIGDVLLRTSGPARGLRLTTGLGDVELAGVAVEGRLALSTGMGDVEVEGAGAPESAELASGMGDISVRGLRCERLSVDTGMGDVELEEVDARAATLASGLGDVEVRRSRGGRLEASSGLGDVEVLESSFETNALDTGLGSVRQR